MELNEKKNTSPSPFLGMVHGVRGEKSDFRERESNFSLDFPTFGPSVLVRPVQQAVPGRLGPILRGLNGSTCWTAPAHLKDGPSRAGPWTPTDWPGMAHKSGGLAVPAGRADGAVPAGRAGGLAHIKFCFLIKSIFFKKNYI